MYNEELAIVQNDADLFGSLRSPESMQKARKISQMLHLFRAQRKINRIFQGSFFRREAPL